MADRENGRVQHFDLDGKYLGEWPSYGKTFSLALVPGVVWLATQHLNQSNFSPGWLIQVDRKTGKVMGYVDATASHGMLVTSSGEVLYAPGPDRKPQIYRIPR